MLKTATQGLSHSIALTHFFGEKWLRLSIFLPNVDILKRVQAEQKARAKKLINQSHSEVTIYEIYQEIFPNASIEELDQYIQKEITAEIKSGFLHTPTISLLKIAKKQNRKTIIVSDIYFNKTHLRKLISSLSPEVSELIDDIYCSSEYGLGKTTGLWKEVLRKEKITPANLLHIGDNEVADYVAPTALGLDAIHFRHTHSEIKKIQTQREIAAALIFPEMRSKTPIPSLWHGWYSEHVDDDTSPEKLIGWSLLGPTLHSFARKIHHQYRMHQNTKIAFLMRDGFMPQSAFNTLYPEIETHSLYISRLTSIRASFISKESIVSHLITFFHSMSVANANQNVTDGMLKLLAKHFGFNPTLMRSIKTSLSKTNSKINELIDIILNKNISDKIIIESMMFRQKLKKHIIKYTGIQPGEHLLLVDLGYEGTTQNLLQDILQKELSITIEGCYMIVAYTPEWKKNRTGVVNPDNIDYRSIKTLTNHIAIYESLCSSHENSTIDYSDTGIPVGEKPAISTQHLSTIRTIQEEALFFISSVAKTLPCEVEAEITSSVIDLIRFIYFPTENETLSFSGLQFDINLGSEQTASLYNIRNHLQKLKKFGAVLINDSNSNNNITNAPTELRYGSIEKSISLLSSYRYGLKWSLTDSTYRKQALDILYISNTKVVNKTLTAMHTHEGCYSAYIPAVTPEVVMQLNIGATAIELISVMRIKNTQVYKIYDDHQAQTLLLNTDWFVDSASIDENLITNLTPASMIYFNPQNLMTNDVIHIVFRPINNS